MKVCYTTLKCNCDGLLNLILVILSFNTINCFADRVNQRNLAYPEIIQPILKAIDGISLEFLTLLEDGDSERNFYKASQLKTIFTRYA